jgi:two-component system, sensor histidine kinase
MAAGNHIGALRQWLRETADDMRVPWRAANDLSTTFGASDAARMTAYAQFRTLIRESPANVAATTVGIGLMAAGLWWMTRSLAAFAWGTTMLICLYWGPMVDRFGKPRHSVQDMPNSALYRAEISLGRVTTVQGALWGSVGFVVPVAARDYSPYLMIVLLMVCVGSITLFVRHRPGITWIAAPCALLGSLSIALTGQLLNVLLSIGLLVVVGLLMQLAQKQNTLMTQALLAAEERLALLAELDTRRQDAENANLAKTRFLAAVSHDLRQPMHTVALLATALRQRATHDCDLIEQIDASVHSMDDLLAVLLDMSKLDTGSVAPRIDTFAFEPLAQRLHKQFEAQARDKGIDLLVQADDSHVISDSAQLHRVLANLIANAIRYTAPKGRVLLRCRRRGNALWMQVWDSGIGIARAHRKQIFDEFYQVRRTEHQGRDGLGLGLSIAKRVTRLLKHPLHLRSRPGRGSVFSVCAPLGVASSERDSDTARLNALLRHQLVLVIDDDRVVRNGMQALFTSLQCHVLLADSTAAALRATQDSLRVPDLIVSDYRLGDNDTGIDAIAAVRTEAAEQIPALLMTAEIGAEPHAAARALGVAVLPKPLQPRALARELERLTLAAH